MTRSSHRERDYAFGQLMLELRTAIGLTQSGLAALLGVSRHAVGGWESGESYPKSEHLKQLVALGVRHHAFAAGHEDAEIRALWRAARQRLFIDEQWLHQLLSAPGAAPVALPIEPADDAPADAERRLDWSDALDVPTLYGRDDELALLTRWAVEERCRVISVLGLGGIGKSALAVTLMRVLAPQFEVVIWRSLRDAPSCDVLLDGCLQVLALQPEPDHAPLLDSRLDRLMVELRERRVLLVLDNLETLLAPGTGGELRADFAAYARLLHRIGATAHASCLLLTSRENPSDLVPLEGVRSPVRTLRLGGLVAAAGAQLLAESDVVSPPHERARLVELYGGNPLALKIVAQTIVDLFGGDVVPFLKQGEVVFGGVQQLLDEQVGRLSALEQSIGAWLAILREPVVLDDLLAVSFPARTALEVVEAVDALHRRSLVERGQRAGSFTLQSVVLEYATARLIAAAAGEIEQGRLSSLLEFGLCRAQAKEYVRQTQEQHLLLPMLSTLQRTYASHAALEARLVGLLQQLREADHTAQGYGPANLVALLRLLRGDLRGLDLSGLALRGVWLQGVEMQNTQLRGATLHDSIFSETFDAVTAVAISSNGAHWAAASREGDIRIWNGDGQTLRRAWRAHSDLLYGLAFSPDSTRVASGSWDGTVRLWDVASGSLLWSGRHLGHVNGLAFSPDGSLLASSGDDLAVRLWNVPDGVQLQSLAHRDLAIALSWSPDGRLLAAGEIGGAIRLWEIAGTQARLRQTLSGHADWVDGLAFSPDGSTLASASNDGTVRLWVVTGSGLAQTLSGHAHRVTRVAWSPDGRTLASGSFDQTIRLWSVETGTCRTVLRGHTAVVVGVAFTPDSRTLLSGSEDGTLRTWDSASGQCLRVTQGYASSLYDLDWSPDGTQLVSAGSDALVTIFDYAGGTPPTVLSGHRGVVLGVGWNPDGRTVASSEWENAIRLWQPVTGGSVQLVHFPHDHGCIFSGLAWSPDGQRLAVGTYRRGVQVWEPATQSWSWHEQEFPTWVRPVAWSPDGTLVAGGSDDGSVLIWDARHGTLLRQLSGHHGKVRCVAWSSDGTRLASGSNNVDSGEILVWETRHGERLGSLMGHAGSVVALAWDASGEVLVSGGSDGLLRWWEVATGQCVRTQTAHHGTVHALKLNPDGNRLASCGDDGAIVLWDLDSGEPLQTLRRDRPYERMDITGLSGVSEAQRTSLLALGALEHVPARAPALTPPPEGTTSLPDRLEPTDERPTGGNAQASTLPFQPTSFVGRDLELTTLTSLLADPQCRLLTLLGPGGAGKTRLALELAAAHAPGYGDGVVFVSLDEVDTPRRLVFAIGAALGVSVVEDSETGAQLIEYVHSRHMLLVLDGFEHLLDGAELVSRMVAGAPQLRVLVTTRERLKLSAEWLFDVGGLEYPPDAEPGSTRPQRQERLIDYGAVQLFIQRAVQVLPALPLDDESLTTIAQICRHVAGLPLAIELAAAIARTLPLTAIEQQIRANLDSLVTTMRDVPPRHRSLRAVFDHSWQLLDEPERALLSRLAVFRGVWTAAAASEVAGATQHALNVLVDKSLLRQSTGVLPAFGTVYAAGLSEPRFTLLEPIREYAREQLQARGEAAALQHAHAVYYLAQAEAAAAQWGTSQFDAAIHQLQREHDNMRAALAWARDSADSMLGLRLADALWQFWRSYGYLSEGRGWLEQVLAIDEAPAELSGLEVRQRALHAAAWMASDQHDYATAARLFVESMALRRAVGQSEGETDLLLNAARQARSEGHYRRAAGLLEQALAWHRRQGHDRATGSVSTEPALYAFGQVLRETGLVAREQGNFAYAEALFEENLAFHRLVGDQSCVAFALLGLADVARDRGDAEGVWTYGEESLAMVRELGMHWAIGFALNTLALGAYFRRDLLRATMLICEAESIFRDLNADASVAEILITLAKIQVAQGELQTARQAAAEALRLATAAGPRVLVAASLEVLAVIAKELGEVDEAVRLLGAASALRHQMGAPARPADQAAIDAVLTTARSMLGDDASAALWSQAQAQPIEQRTL